MAAELPKKIPVTVKADKLDYDRINDIYVAEGHVRVEQEGLRVEADKVVLKNMTGEAVAEGKVYIQDKGDIIRADKIQFNINTKAGFIYNGDLFMSKDNFHLKGEKIERISESVYHVENGTFTTCDQGEWYLKAKKIDVDMERYATANSVSFNMDDLPVFYSPYLLFPCGGRAAS
jgi:LPS-assembly protein